MELEGQGGALGYNPTFRESFETLDRLHLQQNPSSAAARGRCLNTDQLIEEGGERIEKKSSGSSVRYRECLKNHAASVGGNVLDGCGDFMPSGDDGTSEALKCAACNCHRNFHRKEADHRDGGPMLHPLRLPPPLPSPPPLKQHPRVPVGMHTSHLIPIVPPVKMAFCGGGWGTESSSEDLHFYQSNAAPPTAAAPAPAPAPAPVPSVVMSKRRFRTKFTEEQKNRIMEFAEKAGWRIPREDNEEARRFYDEVGVKREVLKVWMHNNKKHRHRHRESQAA